MSIGKIFLQSPVYNGWVHLSSGQAFRECLEHTKNVDKVIQRFHHELGNADTIQPDAALELRSDASELLRENTFCQSVVKMKILKVSRNSAGEEGKKLLAGYKQTEHSLINLQKVLKNRLQEFKLRHPASKSEKFFQGILNFASAKQKMTYEHRVSSGVLFATILIVLPGYAIYAAKKKSKTTPKARVAE